MPSRFNATRDRDAVGWQTSAICEDIRLLNDPVRIDRSVEVQLRGV